MKVIFFETPWKEEILLSKEVLTYFKKNKIKSVSLFASVQFLKLEKVKNQLKDLNIKTTNAKRTNKNTQILGCDAYYDSFKENIIQKTDATLYIGDGSFHPQALLFSQIYQKDFTKIISFNPSSKKMKIFTKKEIISSINKLRANLKRFLMAKTIGIIVTTKPGQQHLELAKKLKQKLKKDTYIFISNTIDFSELENYPFIDCWVNSACPRIGFDDIVNTRKAIINIKEALEPEKHLERLSL